MILFQLSNHLVPLIISKLIARLNILYLLLQINLTLPLPFIIFNTVCSHVLKLLYLKHYTHIKLVQFSHLFLLKVFYLFFCLSKLHVYSLFAIFHTFALRLKLGYVLANLLLAVVQL